MNDVVALPFCLREAVTGELRAAAAALCASSGSTEAAIHLARRSLKRAGALLRLYGPQPTAVRLRRDVREARRQLGGARDADAQAALAATLAKTCPPDLRRAATDVADWLRPTGTGTLPALLDATATALGAAADRAAALPLRRLDRDERSTALRQAYRRARRRLAALGPAPTAEALHDWRGTVKHYAILLRMLARGVLPRQERGAEKLADVLGRHHDLALLVARLDENAGADRPLLRHMRRAIVREERRALRLGRRLFRRPSRRIEARLGARFAEPTNETGTIRLAS